MMAHSFLTIHLHFRRSLLVLEYLLQHLIKIQSSHLTTSRNQQ